MKTPLKQLFTAKVPMFAAVALLFSVGLMLGSCGEETDDFNSQIQCQDYCTKSFQCLSIEPTSAENNTCVTDCRYYIENNCGNDHQAAANAQMAQCVDLGCGEFYACMVFDANPQCFGFVGGE